MSEIKTVPHVPLSHPFVERMKASGYRTDAMLDLYDHEVAVVEPAQSGEAEGVL